MPTKAGGGLKFIVYAPSFDPESGGVIFLHELAHALNQLGEQAFLWPMAPIFGRRRVRRIREWFSPPTYHRNPALETPLATPADLDDRAVAVYPEIVPGNPLGVKNVVRWLLYKPGIRHPYAFTEGEMFFRAFAKADLPEVTGGAPELHLWKVNPVYRNENRPERAGICYTVRKGMDKPRIPETEAPGAILIDGLGAAEVNDIFNRCDTFYSYDEATMYSQYAAACGCLSIVVPGDYPSRAELAAEHDLYRYGIAYGKDDSAHALATRDRVAKVLQQKEDAGLESVRNFIDLTKRNFQRPQHQ